MKIAIIGGIGSGKSTAAQIIKELGYSVYSCDEIYNLVLNEQSYIDEINKNFDGVVENNKIDKKKLGNIVFNNKAKLELLNSIAHPKVREKLDKLILDSTKDIFIEVPVFVGSGLENYFDKVILVCADTKLRIQRIIARNNCDKEYAKKVINNQPSDKELEKYATSIVFNNKDKNALKYQIIKIL